MPTPKPSLLSIGLWIVLAAPLLVFLSFFEKKELALARERIQADADSAASKLGMFMSDRLRTLRMVGHHLEATDLNEEDFKRIAADFDLALPGLKAINWITPDGTITWVYPEAPNQSAQGRNVLDHPTAAASFEVARRSQLVSLTPPLQLFQGTSGVASYTPVMDIQDDSEPGDVVGYLNGVFELGSIVNRALEPELLAHYHVELADGDMLIYPHEATESQASSTSNEAGESLIGETSFLVHDRQWKVTLLPTTASWLQGPWSVFSFVRWAGITFSAVLALAFYQYQVRRRTKLKVQADREKMQASLHEAQKLEAVGRLAGTVAHDFNNLMTTIMGNAALLETLPSMGESELERLGQIQLACDRAAGLTSQLLAFSAHGSTNEEGCEVVEELKQIEPLLRALVKENINLQLSWDYPPSWIAWAPTQLAQVLANLVTNSGDACLDGGTIEVNVARSGKGKQLRIVVRDGGCGMTADALRQATEPFFTTKPSGQGTGLGLASVARLVAEAKGDLQIESEPDVGTAVTIRLPLTEPLVAGPSANESDPALHQKLRIMLVEDETDVRETVASVLADQGHQIWTLPTGQEAWNELQKDTAIDLLITDYKMPGMSGFELAQLIRQRDRTLPIILCSGYAENLEAEEIRSLDIAFLTKPFAIDALARAIRAAFEAVA